MPGEARGSKFMLAQATVMLGAPQNLFHFTPEVNSIGLVKDVTLNYERGSVELTQGLFNDVVETKDNMRKQSVNFNVYEYSSRQLAYGAGLDGGALSVLTGEVQLAVAVAASTGGTSVFHTTSSPAVAGLYVGTYCLINAPGAGGDQVQVRKITAISTNQITVDIPVKHALPLGTRFQKSNFLAIGQKKDTQVLAALIVGQTSDGTPMGMAFPKIRISKGFTVAFQNKEYGNMPFQLDIFDSLPTDPHYALCQANNNASSFLWTPN